MLIIYKGDSVFKEIPCHSVKELKPALEAFVNSEDVSEYSLTGSNRDKWATLKAEYNFRFELI